MADTTPATSTASGSGLEPNISGLLSWLFAPISSIIFIIIEKDKMAKFHAWESLIWTVGAFIVATVLATILTFSVIGACCAWIPYMYYIVNIIGAIKAYNGEMWKLPVIGDFSESQAGK